jgi:(4S)-4-hydroxy-5-phosphonooxypentane-2,3-dione isomerase
MFIFQVHHFIKPENVEEYKAATFENARKTVLEPGVIRFDFFQDKAELTHFSLFEVYRDEQARDEHLQTEHFKKWKEVYLATCERRGNGNEFVALYPDPADWRK